MDALLILVFVVFSPALSVLLLALLLYAVPVRAAVTVILKGGRQEQVLLLSWLIFGIRTFGAAAGRPTEMLIAGHTVHSYSPSVVTDNRAGEAARAGENTSEGTPAGKVMSYGKGAQLDRRPAGPAMPRPFPDMSRIDHIVQNLVRPVLSFGSVFWQQSRFDSASGRVWLGLGDPVLTGEVCGMYWASRFALLASRISVELEPVFDREFLELDVTVRINVKHPLLVLLAAGRPALNPAIREAAGSPVRQSQGVTA